MKARRPAVALAAAALLAAALVTVTTGLLFYRPLPVIDGTYRFLGLRERGEVVRDIHGVAHVFARNAHDLYFLQGYLTAQDRLLQMVELRGFGGSSIRTFGVDPSAVSPEALEALEAYAAGVNKYVEQHAERRALPGELVLLGLRPPPWSPGDSLAIAAVLIERLRSDSTCLAASGLQTFRGRPMLAAEPRGDLPWYEITLAEQSMIAGGLSLPGLPGIVVGHNGWSAWGFSGDTRSAAGDAPLQAIEAIVALRTAFTPIELTEATGSLPLRPCFAHAAAGPGPQHAGAEAQRRLDALLTRGSLDVELARSLFDAPPHPAASARLIVDLAESDSLWAVLPLGQSVQRASRFFDDQRPLWDAGRLHRTGLTRDALGRILGELVLRPR